MNSTFPTRLVALALAASLCLSAMAIGTAFVRIGQVDDTTRALPAQSMQLGRPEHQRSTPGVRS